MGKELNALLRAFQNVEAEIEAVQSVVGPRQYTRLRELAAQIDGHVDRLLADRQTLIDEIMRLPQENYRTVLLLRDVGGLKFSDVAAEMRFSTRQIFRLYKKAREALDAITP